MRPLMHAARALRPVCSSIGPSAGGSYLLRTGGEAVHALAQSSQQLPVKRAWSRPPDGNPRTDLDHAGIDILAARLLADACRQNAWLNAGGLFLIPVLFRAVRPHQAWPGLPLSGYAALA